MLFGVPYPSIVSIMLHGFLGSGDFCMAALSCQRNECGKQFAMSCPKISTVLDHAQEPTEVFDLFWQCNSKDRLHFVLLWLYACLCEDIPKVFHFNSTEFQFGGIDLQACFSQSQPGKD
jgi:hypothetical protein